jgi:hypothetical protein
MAVDDNDADSELEIDAAVPDEPEDSVKIGAELTEFGRQFGGIDLDVARDAMATEHAEFVEVREMLDRRYDQIKSGLVKAIPGDEVEAHFRAKSAAHRKQQEEESKA